MELLPSYSELKNQFPLSSSQSALIEKSRHTIRSILDGIDSRLLLIVGPCSIHDSIAAKDFAAQLKKLSQAVSSQFFIVMRVYCEKPRTASGWKGLLYDPHLDGSHDLHTGIRWTRELLLDLASLSIPAATEFLDPLTAPYYEDLISWGSIGARTSSSQIHRQLASGLNMPVGIKNGIAGNISAAVQGVLSASKPHTYMGLSEEGLPCIKKTTGNSHAHVVLRGGEAGPNYDPCSVSCTLQNLEKAFCVPRLLIDCSHGNSNKQFERQLIVLQSVIHQIIEGNSSIRGLLLESNLAAGCQSIESGRLGLKYGVSVTDACLDWKSTEQMIEWAASQLHKTLSSVNDSLLVEPLFSSP
jgi:3-deoxy-7-phosphoheptulonate synthase